MPSPPDERRGTSRPRLSLPKRLHAGYLLIALLALFVLLPILQSGVGGESLGEHGRRGVLHYVVIAVLLVAATTVAQASRPWVVIALLFGVPAALQGVADAVREPEMHAAVQATRHAYTGLALLYVVWRGLARLLTRRAVDAETIAVAICAYLLIGLAWMSMYEACNGLAPRAFGETQLGSADLFYFSYVTLTTLGYGDITPKLPVVRSLAVVEAIVGQMYVAVVIARLVSSYLATPSDD